MLSRHFDENTMALYRRGDVDEIEATVCEQGIRITVASLNAKLIADDFQPLGISVADRKDLCAIDIAPGVHLVDCKESATD